MDNFNLYVYDPKWHSNDNSLLEGDYCKMCWQNSLYLTNAQERMCLLYKSVYSFLCPLFLIDTLWIQIPAYCLSYPGCYQTNIINNIRINRRQWIVINKSTLLANYLCLMLANKDKIIYSIEIIKPFIFTSFSINVKYLLANIWTSLHY